MFNLNVFSAVMSIKILILITTGSGVGAFDIYNELFFFPMLPQQFST